MPTFVVSREGRVLGTYSIQKDIVTVGRSHDNTIAIAHNSLSRHHVRMERTPKGYVLIDLDSMNGSYVNNMRIKSTLLSNGDRILIGHYLVVFRDDDEDRHTPPAVAPEASKPSEAPPKPAARAPIRVDDGEHDLRPPSEKQAQQAQRNTVVMSYGDPLSSAVQAPWSSTPAPAAAGGFTSRVAAMPAADAAAARQWKGGAPADRAKLGLEDKVKCIVYEHPLFTEDEIRKTLATPEYGDTDLSKGKLKALLKALNLDSKNQRLFFGI